ncbi:MAG: methylase [Bacteroidota bacterium]|jgi:alkylated DNA repair dioxygenase AlkB|nr:methylase [Bacteroidota bacterium]
MDLFTEDFPVSILPYDGTVLYYGKVFSLKDSDEIMQELLSTIEWKNDEAVLYGKHFITPRKVAWYADKNYSYSYSGTTKHALLWTAGLLALKSKVEQITKRSYNSCLLNLYHTGDEGMAWHSDDERSLDSQSSIASVTFGAERKFSFKHKRTKETASLVLEHGSLLEMKGSTQTNWMHRLPPTTKVKRPRVNLTFRSMKE